MTDRIKGLTVTLKDDMREDDCDFIINAITMIKGVVSVDSHVSGTDHHMAKRQLKSELRQKVFKILEEL